MSKVYKCKSQEVPEMRYGDPQKGPGRSGYYVVCENRERHRDLLFQTTVLELMSDMDPDSDEVELVVPSESPMQGFFDTMSQEHIKKAIDAKEQWFPGKNVSDEVLPDLWKQTLSKSRLRLKVGDDEEEPMMLFDRDKTVAPPESFKKGTRVVALMRLEGLWFSKASLGESYTLVQMMKHDAEPVKPERIKECALDLDASDPDPSN